MNIPRPLAALGAAAAISLAAPAALAHADTVRPRDTGTFTYYNAVLGQQRLVDPPNDRCLGVDGQNEAGPVGNQTHSLAVVFLLPDCFGPSFVVYPGQTTTVPFPVFASVVFVR